MAFKAVTIEGTLTPAAGVLERGERKTVQYTDRIDRLVTGGFIRIIEFLDDGVEQVAEATDAPVEVEEVNPLGGHPLDEVIPDPPARNASRDDWAEYLAKYTDIETEGKDRGDLITAWDHYDERLNAESS